MKFLQLESFAIAYYVDKLRGVRMNRVFTVTEVNSYIKTMFMRDYALNQIYIKGEVSNCKYHTSGHIYFTLKDAQGQIACVMFAGNRQGLSFRMTEGQSVIALGSVSVYERDGKYQLYAREILLDGAGKLYEQFEAMKQRLAAEGLFSEEHKKPIPQFAKKIGIVTAQTGAAIQDICNISKRRNPYVQLYLYPALVQGEGAAASVVKGIKILDEMNLDVLIVGRGGGSIEDLWAFNEEIVARAIYAAKTPIISAVGHETDVTIADFVSDLRAPTPSAAAELAITEFGAIQDMMQMNQLRIQQLIRQKIGKYRQQVETLEMQLKYTSPMYQIQQKRQNLIDLEERLSKRMNEQIMKKRHDLQLYMERLHGLSPITQLNRGYSLVTKGDNVVHSVNAVSPSDVVTISVKDGDIEAVVSNITQINRNV